MVKQNLKKHTELIISWIAMIAWMSLIFYLSNQPNLSTGLGAWDFIGRKFAHLAEFGVLTLLVWNILGKSVRSKTSKTKLLAAAVLFAFFYAASDEYHQTFIPGRVGTPRDVAIDGVGILAAAFFIQRKPPDFLK